MKEIKDSGYVNASLLRGMGGKKQDVSIHGATTPLVTDGAYLWGVEDRDKGKGVFNHVMLTARSAYYLGRELQEKQVPGYENLNLHTLVDAAILHDVVKLGGEDREALSPDQKVALGLPANFREIMEEADEMGIEWLKISGLSPEVYEAIRAHDFPQRIIDDPYWKIVLIADYMSGQKIMTVDNRLADVKTRWIDERVKQGQEPRIEPERFDAAQKNIEEVAAGIFSGIGMSDQEFIDVHDLNSDSSMRTWEKLLRRTRDDWHQVDDQKNGWHITKA